MFVARPVKRRVRRAVIGSLKMGEVVEVSVLLREKVDVCEDPEPISTDLEICTSEFVDEGIVTTLKVTLQPHPGPQTSVFKVAEFTIELIMNVTTDRHVSRDGVKYLPKKKKTDEDERDVEPN